MGLYVFKETGLLCLSNHQSLKITCLKILLFLLSLFTFSFVHAQERLPVNGKVTSDFDDLEGIYVINKTADLSVITARGGYFTINAKLNDTIIFSAMQFVARELVIEEKDIDNKKLLLVPLEKNTRVLDELIIVDYRHINAESLGLVPKGQKQYTPAERKLFTARSGVDALFNAISGRTKMLKTAVETSKKEEIMAKINYIYTEEELISQFKIPKLYVRGFVFYLVEDANFARAIKDKNDTMAKFLMSGLAGKYLKLINDEK